MSSPTPLARFHSAINASRDILRKEGITGMDSMKHLTLYVLARALNESECHRLGINERFAWERFMDLASKDNKRQECYDLLYNYNGNDLISHLDSIFGTRNFNFKLRNPDNHVSILKILNMVNIKELEGSIDILGTVYENHLGSGSNKSAMRDLGQFFTDRRVCSYMTKLCDPQVYPDQTVESILDPTMGTGGFLTASVHFVNQKKKTVNWSKMQMDIAGYDIDEFVMCIGRINMYLSTGVVFDRIAHRDTLTQDVGEVHQRLKFRIILANMPFGVKGLKFADCCRRIKDLKCDGTKSEPLFLNLMMASLDDGGRCAVVVPDGVLINNSKQHNATRKYLLDHFELKRVIKMKGQFFSNTGIQPSILFFENSGDATKSIEFWEVEQGSNGQVNERFLLTVSRDSLDDACSLDVRQHQETTPLQMSNSYPKVKLGDILTDHVVKKPVSQKDADHGPYPLFSSSAETLSHTVAEFPAGEYIIQGSRGTIAKAIHYQTQPFSVTNNVFVLSNKDTQKVLLKYVYHWLKASRIADSIATTSVIPMLTKQMFEAIQMPLPPLEIQQQIVSALDAVYQSAYSANLCLESNAMQGKMIIQSIFTQNAESSRLGDLLTTAKGPLITISNAVPGPFPLYSASTDIKSHETAGFDATPSIIQACVGSNLEHCIHYVEQPFAATANLWVLRLKSDNTKADLKFLYYLLKESTDSILSKVNRSVLPKINKSDFDDILVPIPEIELQKKILVQMDSLERERKSLQAILEQTETRAKFLLEQFLQG